MSAKSWKLTLPCNKREAERLAGDVPEIEGFDPPPVLMTSEPDPDRPEEWRLEVFFDGEPEADVVAAVRSLVPSADGLEAAIDPIEDEDWLRLSQRELEPILAGRFCVHTSAHRADVPAGTVAIEIDAGRAFGTGHHETTTGCLIALDRLKEEGFAPANVADVGTGTGLLTYAALHLWPRAHFAASDIDPVSIEVAAVNAEVNAIPLGTGAGQVELIVAPGLADERLQARVPYDLIVANILAGPLIELAPDIGAALAPGAHLILAGLLAKNEQAVTAAYRAQGFTPAFTIARGDWPTLVLRKT